METSARILKNVPSSNKGSAKTESGPCLHDRREPSRDFLVLGGVPTLSFFANGETDSSMAQGANEPAQWKRAGYSCRRNGQSLRRRRRVGPKVMAGSKAQVVARDPKRISQARQELQDPGGSSLCKQKLKTHTRDQGMNHVSNRKERRRR